MWRGYLDSTLDQLEIEHDFKVIAASWQAKIYVPAEKGKTLSQINDVLTNLSILAYHASKHLSTVVPKSVGSFAGSQSICSSTQGNDKCQDI